MSQLLSQEGHLYGQPKNLVLEDDWKMLEDKLEMLEDENLWKYPQDNI